MERLHRLVAAKPGHGQGRHQPGATRLAIQRPQEQGLSETLSSLSGRNIMGKLRSGIFLAPFHPVDEDPTLAIRRDIELIEWLDKIGFEEAWIGEHHSAGYEIIASPELFIAAAAERTHRIKLGTGVVSLPYHNPLMAANRIIQLDHMTRGRVMFGVGPGLLPSDAFMLGIEVAKQRDRMVEGLEVILRLFKGETVTEETEWFTLNKAKLQLRPFSDPYPEVDRKSTRLNSSHVRISYAVFCLKKKTHYRLVLHKLLRVSLTGAHPDFFGFLPLIAGEPVLDGGAVFSASGWSGRSGSLIEPAAA